MPPGSRPRLAAEVVVFVGRLEALPRRAAARLVEESGGQARRGITRRTRVIVVGHGAPASLGLDRLQNRLDLGWRCGAAAWSENRFLRQFGVGDAAPAGARTFDAATVCAQSGLEAVSLRLLSLLDLVEPIDDRYGFQDIVTGRTVARLLNDGATLADVVVGLMRARRAGARAAPPIVRCADGTMALRLGNDVAEMDGQLRLPLAPAPGKEENPSVDELFEAAQWAEEEARWQAAERHYRRCVDLDRADPTGPFNLANVLHRQGRLAEAALYFRLALSIDPAFAEAWYNLAHVAEAQGRGAMALECLQHAVDADRQFGDALYNLALLRFHNGDHQDAARLWRRYLAVDGDGEWARRARAGLALCAPRSPTA